MNLSKIIITVILGVASAAAQTLDIERGIVLLNGSQDLPTSIFLRAIKWDSLVASSHIDNPIKGEQTYTNIVKDSLITKYRYARQGLSSYINFTDYKGVILEYDIHTRDDLRPFNGTYFDKLAWIRYSHDCLPQLPDSLKLSSNELQDILVNYYTLLGVGVRSEYGWSCEYSTVGLAPMQRRAVIDLILNERIDLLRRVLSFSNVVARAYAADALLYLKYLSLEPDPIPKQFWTSKDSSDIDVLKRSGGTVSTCGNNGSYKTNSIPISMVLSDSAIAEIPLRYEDLKKTGYFRK